MADRLTFDDEYYMNREYNHDDKLKKYDAFNDRPPIVYTEGCKRRLVVEDGCIVVEPAPGFGKFIMKAENEEEATEAINDYRRALASHLLACVYKGGVVPERLAAMTPEEADEIIMRFMPSISYFMTSDDGAQPYEPNPDSLLYQDDLMDRYRHPDPEVRKKLF